MIYILILMWAGSATYDAGKAAITQEFSTKDACMQAAVLASKQAYSPQFIMCVPKNK